MKISKNKFNNYKLVKTLKNGSVLQSIIRK